MEIIKLNKVNKERKKERRKKKVIMNKSRFYIFHSFLPDKETVNREETSRQNQQVIGSAQRSAAG